MIALLLALAVAPGPTPQPAPTPFARAVDRAVGYEGPGREEEAPASLTEIKLGWFGPADAAHPEGGAFWQGATLGLEDANSGGGLPLRLVAGWSDSPWTGGAREVARLVFQEKVWAIVGSIDGAATHVAEQLAVKAGILVLSPGSTDESVNMANVPWMLSLLPSDAAQAPALVEALAAAARAGPFILVAGSDHDARAAWSELRRETSRRGLSPARELALPAEGTGAAEVAAKVMESAPKAVLVAAGARPAGRFVRALRAAGFRGAVLGGATLGLRGFREEAGDAAEGAVFPLLAAPSPVWDAFAVRFVKRFGREPDYAAGAAYDAVRLVVAAVRRSGANRPRILDAVRALAPYPGVTGAIAFDPLGRSERKPGLATIRGGRVEPR